MKYHQDENLARKIIKCESSFYANATGTAAVVGQDIGWWQLNTFYQELDAKKAGFDIYNKWDNLEYGFILMRDRGTQPWSASESCWLK